MGKSRFDTLIVFYAIGLFSWYSSTKRKVWEWFEKTSEKVTKTKRTFEIMGSKYWSSDCGLILLCFLWIAI